MENDIKKSKRDNEKKDQIGRGLKKLYGKVKDCDGYNLRNVMLSLSENDINRICVCVQEYLCGNLNVGNNTMRRLLDGDRHINKDLIDIIIGDIQLKKRRNFCVMVQGVKGIM